jgi:phage terminase large subunit-like protein
MPDALDVLAALVLEDGRRWGEAAVDFQWTDARAILDPDSSTPYSFLTRSRGASKTADLAGVAIAAMLAQLPAASRLYGLAADRDQGRLLIESIEGYLARTPELRGALEIGAFKVTATRGGSTLEILAADAPGAWGLRPRFVVCDEIAQWGETGAPRRLWEAVTSSVAKIAGCRMAVLTTAGDPSHWSRKVLDHALSDPLWRVHEVPGPAPWLDPERVAEQRRRLLDSSYRRLFLNEWVAAEDRLADPDDLRACVTLDGPLAAQPNVRYVIGLDLGVTADRTVAAVCHAEATTGYEHGVGEYVRGSVVLLDRLRVWAGSRAAPVKLAEVEEWVFTASESYNRAHVRLDPWQALGLAQRLRARGVVVEEFTFSSSSVGRLASTLALLIRNRALRLPDDADLIDELAAVRLRETSPGVVRMDHDAGRKDDRAVSIALGASYLLDARPALSPDSAASGGSGDLWGDLCGDPDLVPSLSLDMRL